MLAKQDIEGRSQNDSEEMCDASHKHTETFKRDIQKR